MKLAFLAVAGIAAAIMFNAIPAQSAETAKEPAIKQTQKADEISAARKRRVLIGGVWVDGITNETYPRFIAPSNDFVGGPSGYPGEYAWRRSIGQCVMDMGYGRWRPC